MTTLYGFTEEAWAAAKEEMRQALIQRTKLRSCGPWPIRRSTAWTPWAGWAS